MFIDKNDIGEEQISDKDKSDNIYIKKFILIKPL